MNVACGTCGDVFRIATQPMDNPDEGLVITRVEQDAHWTKVIICAKCLKQFRRDFYLELIEEERRKDNAAAKEILRRL